MSNIKNINSKRKKTIGISEDEFYESSLKAVDVINKNIFISNVISLFDHETIERIRNSKGDAEVRKLILMKINNISN